jgi:hypothetical protein
MRCVCGTQLTFRCGCWCEVVVCTVAGLHNRRVYLRRARHSQLVSRPVGAAAHVHPVELGADEREAGAGGAAGPVGGLPRSQLGVLCQLPSQRRATGVAPAPRSVHPLPLQDRRGRLLLELGESARARAPVAVRFAATQACLLPLGGVCAGVPAHVFRRVADLHGPHGGGAHDRHIAHRRRAAVAPRDEHRAEPRQPVAAVAHRRARHDRGRRRVTGPARWLRRHHGAARAALHVHRRGAVGRLARPHAVAAVAAARRRRRRPLPPRALCPSSRSGRSRGRAPQRP